MISKLLNLIKEKRKSVLVTNSLWSISGQGIVAICSFAETLLLARFLSTEHFGILIILSASVEFVYGLLDFRTGEAMIKFIPELSHKNEDNAIASFLGLIFRIDLFIAIGGFALLFFIAGSILKWQGLDEEYRFLLIIIAFGAAWKQIVRSAGSYLRVTNFFSLSIKAGSIIALLRTLALISIFIIVPKVSYIAFIFALSDIFFFFTILAAVIYAMKKSGGKFNTFGVLEKRFKKEIFHFLISTSFAGTIKVIATKFDVILIGALSSPAVVAVYKLGGRIAGTLLLFSDPLLTAVFPEISKMKAANEIDKLKHTIIKISKVMLVFAAITVATFFYIGEMVIVSFAGTEYTEAYFVALIMFIGTSGAMIFFWARPLMLLAGMLRLQMQLALIAAIAQFALILFLVPVLGATGAALAFALYYLLYVGITLLSIQQRRIFIPQYNNVAA